MKVAIMGAGFVGGSLAKGLTRAGHEVMLSSRNPQSEKIQTLLAEIGAGAQAGTIAETFAYSDVIALALGGDAVGDVIQKMDDWSGKIVLDMTQGSLRDLARITGTAVVKVFNSIGAEHYQTPDFDGQSATMLYCGDDADAKAIAAQLASDLGFDAIDAGDSSASDHLVNLARLWIHLAFQAGLGRDFAFKVHRR